MEKQNETGKMTELEYFSIHQIIRLENEAEEKQPRMYAKMLLIIGILSFMLFIILSIVRSSIISEMKESLEPLQVCFAGVGLIGITVSLIISAYLDVSDSAANRNKRFVALTHCYKSGEKLVEQEDLKWFFPTHEREKIK